MYVIYFFNYSRKNLKQVSKAIITIKDKDFWNCLLLSKEKSNGKYSLFWWWIKKNEIANWLKKELIEELWPIACFTIRNLFDFEKPKWEYLYHINKVEIWGNIILDPKEIIGIWLYPLDKKFKNIKQFLEESMTWHCEEALKILFQRKKNITLPEHSIIWEDTNWKSYREKFYNEIAHCIS